MSCPRVRVPLGFHTLLLLAAMVPRRKITRIPLLLAFKVLRASTLLQDRPHTYLALVQVVEIWKMEALWRECLAHSDGRQVHSRYLMGRADV